MSNFLKEQAQHIYQQHQGEFDQISVIIPNRRAAVYLQKYLADIIQKPFYAPEILTIHEWIDKNTPQNILNKTELLFVLYEIHCELMGENKEDFDQFILWGQIMLSDFDEIDRYLIPPETAFQNLKDIKALESWDIEESEMGKAQKLFEKLWDQLGDYYNLLNKKLAEQNAIYSGKAYLNFYERLNQIKIPKKVFFLGFNAISKVEESIMKQLIIEEKAEVIFDIDKFYFDNPHHEAAHFYRKLCKEWKIKPTVRDDFNSSPKSIEIIECSQQVSQAKIGGALVKELKDKNYKMGNTAVVLADESLLIPFTKSLPQDLEKANITMGWPIKFSHLQSFLDIVFDFQFNFQKFKSSKIYHKTLTELIQHPYTKSLLGKTFSVSDILNEITKSNQIFIEKESLLIDYPGLAKFENIFKQWPKSNSGKLEVFDGITTLLYGSFKNKEEREIDLEIIYQFNLGLQKFVKVVSQQNIELKLHVFKNLFYQFWQNETLSFLGNPIDGLQVMGILETRTIDFDNLIFLGMNEGNLPKTNSNNSFIPRDLRLYLNLPTEEDRQAIFSHHFYRSLHRAENVYMVYNSTTDKMSSGEKSRYIIQLENELDKSFHHFKTSVYSGNDTKATTSQTVYKSTPEVHKKLDELIEQKGLSPSALNKLIYCPLDFYYRYILDFKEDENVEESIESSTFGTAIHEVLERIIEDNFKDGDTYQALNISKLSAENKPEQIRKRLETAYLKGDGMKQYKLSDLQYGQNKLSFDVSMRLIGSFLKEQIDELKNTEEAVTPIDLEKAVEASFSISRNGLNKQIKIQGHADRIDKKGEVYRILDYKSGKSKADKLVLKDDLSSAEKMENLFNNPDLKFARQLLMYGIMFRSTYKSEIPDSSPLQAGIISMINISDWIQSVSYKGNNCIDNQLLELFQNALGEFILDLYDPDFEFKHNPDSMYCQHCGK
ncbi:PD-(D/E)XK nuclease family protein [Paracrocinitomix mangrovi]|uniref:PD-(D/E)XK nuclease family protein n=1 Tax=Paracrocinitomix mangrovi TaxID=2862509 RepID=UPI001C8E4D32|nr:PD-(D/E)XK nuclease family protein [Paracrocinitomix mangrovi]UKN03406.1 PD-(D/E)XK nuclease family protein [Paracrocinitomix mangrovi]